MKAALTRHRGWGTPNAIGMPTALVVGLVLFLPLSYLMLYVHRPGSVWLLKEDGVNESLGALAMAVGAGLAISAWRVTGRDEHSDYRGFKRTLLLLLALLLIFGAGEEISWGQRIFGWGTPHGLVHSNSQDETNVHDLKALHGVLTVSRLGQLFWLGFALAIPALCLIRPRLRRPIERRVPILPLVLGFLFLYAHVIMKVVQAVYPAGAYDGPKTAKHEIVEIREMHIELLSFVALACIRFSLGRSRTPPQNPRDDAPETTEEASAVSA
jgi:hypothetical protein